MYNPVNRKEFRKWLEQCAEQDERVGMGGSTISCPIAIYCNRKLGTDNQVSTQRSGKRLRTISGIRDEWIDYGKHEYHTLPNWALQFMRYVDNNYPCRDILASEALAVLDKVIG